ncbi:hypothetical protein ACQEVF_55285 [Nonomuraea polychroma]|uniref:hypothetical protein n=1 Tax=Nonomuraea polychroma TaxID=46176 RepID=UPI003D90A80B
MLQQRAAANVTGQMVVPVGALARQTVASTSSSRDTPRWTNRGAEAGYAAEGAVGAYGGSEILMFE